MTQSMTGHYDGQFFVPDEPVDLPINTPLTFELTDVGTRPSAAASREQIEERRRRWARVAGCICAPAPTDESLRRENIYRDDV